MKNIFATLLLLFFITSCTDTEERDEINFVVNINNNTNQQLSVRGYNSQNVLEFDYTISSMSNGAEINYSAETFGGYINGSDSIIFSYPNSKGYICDLRQNGNNLCFQNKNIFGDQSDFNNITNNTFEFVITQDDFDNAYDLP